MRRFASVFSSKREKSDSSANPSGVHPSLSFRKKGIRRAHTLNVQSSPLPSPLDSIPSTPQLSVGGSEPSQSSASSAGSASLQTPEEEHVILGQSTPTSKTSRAWITWLGKRSGTIKRPTKPDQSLEEWDLTPPPAVRPNPANVSGRHDPDETEDESSSEDEDEDDDSAFSHPPTRTFPVDKRAVSSSSSSNAKRSLQVTIQNSLHTRLCSSPFLQLPDRPQYPRSCNISRSLPYSETLRSSMHKRRLLERLQQPLSSDDEASIAAFGFRKPPVQSSSELPLHDEIAPSHFSRVTEFSAGVRRWMARLCFEDRYSVWIVRDGVLAQERVNGSNLGVAALEYSEGLEAMVDFGAPPSPMTIPATGAGTSQSEPVTPISDADASPSPSSSSSNLSLPYSRAIQPAAPSPLRIEHQVSSSSASQPDGTTAIETERRQPAKRGVRFAEDDKADGIPIGYILRMKKQREQKARFLQEQKEKRAFEEERRKFEVERQKREQERKRWEQEREAWEKEKKAIEDEKKRRLYAEEVAASRQRRESQRAGYAIGSKANLTSSYSSSSLRESDRHRNEPSHAYARPVYDRRQASEPMRPLHPPHGSSESLGGSRPPSIAGHSPPRNSQNLTVPPHLNSRPSSVHSSQTLSSVASNHDYSTNSLTWSPSRTSLLIPSGGPYPLDMPLLPPNAPFMMNQHSRRRSNPSPLRHSSPSSSPSRTAPPSNSSSERLVPPSPTNRGPIASLSSHRSATSSSPHSRPRGNTRRSSGEARGSSMQHSSSMPSRGRPALPASMFQPQQSPNPWTAPPTQSGRLPTGMPYEASPRTQPTRRQTTT